MQKKKPYKPEKVRSQTIQLRFTVKEKQELKSHIKQYSYNTTGQFLRKAIKTQIEKDKNN